MDYEVVATIIFIVVLGIFLWIKRKNLVVQRIFFPVFYMILYRSKIGLKWMDTLAAKYREAIKLFGYCSIGIGFLGMVYVSISIVLFFIKLIFKPGVAEPGVSLVLPFTDIPGVGYLPFSHWIISLFILAVIHEFSHGVVARAHNVEVKFSGFAFFSIFLPVIPAAFVEPDEKKLKRHSDVVQYSVFAAGPVINLIFAAVLLIAFPYVADATQSAYAPFEEMLTDDRGFSFELLNSSYPAAQAGLQSGMIITAVNGQPVTNYLDFHKEMQTARPQETLVITTPENVFTLETTASPDNPRKGFIGIKPVKNERVMKPEYKQYEGVYYWFRGLLRWLFLLNFFIGLANLMPLGIVDGGRMLHTALQSLIKHEGRAKKVWVVIALAFLGMLLFGLVVNYFGNPFRVLG